MIEIVEAGEADVQGVLDLIEPFVELKLLLPRDEEEILRLAKRGFVAKNAVQIVGFASLDVYSKKMAEIQCLAVHAEYQDKGIGKRLVDQCIALARREGILELMAISSSDHFLKRCGFDYSLPDQKRALFYRFDMDEM